ncbi:DUF2339 domain-containing protein [Oricola sp.]|uniref:DUF2339 domain-containing protein n=1 Tax=Oricola sp. TaxID=1979950 RepID=UPI003BACF83C
MNVLFAIFAIILAFWLRSAIAQTRQVQRELDELRNALRRAGIAIDERKAETEAEPEPEADAQAAGPWGARPAARAGDEASDAPAARSVPDAEPVALPESLLAAPSEAEPESEPAAPRRSAADIERLLGASWSVILGGVAIALGALFLVRYSIEAGLLGPGARIAAGVMLSAGLFAAGEWLRRRDREVQAPVFRSADIPGVLTGAGAVGAFGTLFAAHALYGFVGPAFAFAGLTAIGIASLLLSAIHGPKLAAIGLLGAYGAPVLVSSDAPSAFALAAHTLIVTASVMTVARIRDWLWLAFGGVVGGTIWAALLLTVPDGLAPLWAAVLLAGLAAVYAATFAWEKADRPVPPEDRKAHRPALVAFWLLALVYALHAAGSGDFPAAAAGLAVAGLMIATAGFWPAMSAVAGAAAFVVLISVAAIDLPYAPYLALYGVGEDPGDLLVPANIGAYVAAIGVVAVPVCALALTAARRAAASAPRMTGKLAIAVSLIGVFSPVIAYLRIAPFETHVLFGAASLALALFFALMTEVFTRMRPDDWSAPAPAAFAVASAALIAFALGVSLSGTWLPFGLALAAAGIAWVWRSRPLKALPWLALAASLLAALGLWSSMPFAGETIGTIPFLNRLIIIVGLPAAAVLYAGELLRRGGAGRPGAAVTAIGLALLGLFVALQLRHWINGGEITGGRFGLADMAVQTIAALSFAIGLQRLARYANARIFDRASIVFGGLSAAMIALGLFVFFNPLVTGDEVGATAVFNLLLPAYFLTAVLAGIVALMARPVRPRWYTLGYALLAGLLGFAFFTFTVRHGFQGSRIGFWRGTSDLELWTYSAIWLALGACLLPLGLYLKSLPVRLASAAVIALTVCKVFLLDMTALTGVLRAISFIGLGLSLVAIGRFYQRVVLRPQKTQEQD